MRTRPDVHDRTLHAGEPSARYDDTMASRQFYMLSADGRFSEFEFLDAVRTAGLENEHGHLSACSVPIILCRRRTNVVLADLLEGKMNVRGGGDPGGQPDG